MKIVWTIRIILALVLLWDLPVLLRCVVLLSLGGSHAIQGWIAHVALMGRFFDTTEEQQRAMIRYAYFFFGLMLFVVPAALYLLQKWLARRAASPQSR
jgi:DMSO/TMAO reductase YedYZ heme-binding membrane subunit